MEYGENEPLVCLDGSPERVGSVFGRTNAPDIRREVEQFYATVEAEEGITTMKAGISS